MVPLLYTNNILIKCQKDVLSRAMAYFEHSRACMFDIHPEAGSARRPSLCQPLPVPSGETALVWFPIQTGPGP